MTNFEIITQSPTNLSDFIDMVVDDALEAKGCSLDLTMPTEEARRSPMFGLHGYKEWLELEGDKKNLEDIQNIKKCTLEHLKK